MNIASVLQGLATFSWLVVVGIIVLAVIRASRARPLKGAVMIVVGTAVFALNFDLGKCRLGVPPGGSVWHCYISHPANRIPHNASFTGITLGHTVP